MGSSKNYSNGYWKVYVHINKTNGKRYVGITSQKPEYRWNYGNAYAGNKHFTAAIQKYGWDGFEHIVLHDLLSEEDAKKIERKLISAWNTQYKKYGYNITAGGEGGTGYVPSKELRQRWSEMRTGTKRPDETKRKLAEASRRTYEKKRIPLAEAKYKPVNMYTMDGTFIKRFDSIVAAMSELGIKRGHISAVCTGKRKSCAGYYWQYA